jgi:hypothetical protein
MLLPLIGIFFAFASYNLDQAAALPGAHAPRWSLAELTYYARIMPSVISWPTLVLACLYVLALPIVPALRLARADAGFLGSWVLVGYAFYSMIAVKEPPHILFLTYPLALAAVLVIDRTLVRASPALCDLFGLCGCDAGVDLGDGHRPGGCRYAGSRGGGGTAGPAGDECRLLGIARRYLCLCHARLLRAP